MMRLVFRNTLLLIFLTALLCLLPQLITAQNTATEKEVSGFGFRGAGISAGWYKPSNDYWNNNYFKDHGWENSFSGTGFYGAFIELSLYRNLYLRGAGSLWSQKVNSGTVKTGEVKGTEELTTTLTTLSLDLRYKAAFLTFAGISPYAGAGANFEMIRNKFRRQPFDNEEELYTNHGQDLTGMATVGLERLFARHLGVALEFNYIFGGYTQEMKQSTQGEVTSHRVSLAGPRIGLHLSYRLK